MDTANIRLCNNDDLDMLAVMNRQLIEDEQHDNTMDIGQLKERMRGFISGDYNACMFTDNNGIIGYALVDMKRTPLYLRQFFITRDKRRKGYGTLAFNRLMQLLGTGTMDIEVMVWNDTGKAFWKSLGFKERSVYMRKKAK